MVIGILQFELLIPGAMSLKDKRRVVKSLKDRLHRHHMVAVAEVGALETWNVALLGLTAVSSDGRYLSAMLDRILAELRRTPDAQLGEVSKQIVDSEQMGGEVDIDAEPLWTDAERRDEPHAGDAA